MLNDLAQVSRGLTRKYPHGNDRYQIMTRLLEECGELAQEVNRAEGSGVKQAKHGPADPQRLAEEASHVLRAVMQLVQYYGVEANVDAALQGTCGRLINDGYLEL